MRLKFLKLSTCIGVLFLLLGILTILGSITLFQTAHLLRWGYLVYATIDFAIAYGFFTTQYWLVPALSINLAGAVVQSIVKAYMHSPSPDDLQRIGLNLSIAGLVLLAAWYVKKSGTITNTFGQAVGAVFLLSWITMTCYTLVNLV